MFKRSFLMLFIPIVLAGCATAAPMRGYKSIENINELIKNNIIVNTSTKIDVANVLGTPDVKSIYESSSVENQISKIPFMDQIDHPFESDVFPYETWTYIHAQDQKAVKDGRSIKIVGVNVIAKDLKVTSIVFSRAGKVLGYSVLAHYVE